MKNKFIVGTRGSLLALRQTNIVINKLKELYSDISFEIKIIKTTGDIILDKTLDKIGGKGIFINEIEEKLSVASTDKQRIKIVEYFLLTQLKDIKTDKLIIEAVKLIYQTKGTIRVKELNEKLCISQSPFEKRFRKIVGTTPKKFSSIIRFNAVLDKLNDTKSLTEICYENNFFDQAHFIKDFKHFTGQTPEEFKRFL